MAYSVTAVYDASTGKYTTAGQTPTKSSSSSSSSSSKSSGTSAGSSGSSVTTGGTTYNAQQKSGTTVSGTSVVTDTKTGTATVTTRYADGTTSTYTTTTGNSGSSSSGSSSKSSTSSNTSSNTSSKNTSSSSSSEIVGDLDYGGEIVTKNSDGSTTTTYYSNGTAQKSSTTSGSSSKSSSTSKSSNTSSGTTSKNTSSSDVEIIGDLDYGGEIVTKNSDGSTTTTYYQNGTAQKSSTTSGGSSSSKSSTSDVVSGAVATAVIGQATADATHNIYYNGKYYTQEEVQKIVADAGGTLTDNTNKATFEVQDIQSSPVTNDVSQYKTKTTTEPVIIINSDGSISKATQEQVDTLTALTYSPMTADNTDYIIQANEAFGKTTYVEGSGSYRGQDLVVSQAKDSYGNTSTIIQDRLTGQTSVMSSNKDKAYDVNSVEMYVLNDTSDIGSYNKVSKEDLLSLGTLVGAGELKTGDVVLTDAQGTTGFVVAKNDKEYNDAIDNILSGSNSVSYYTFVDSKDVAKSYAKEGQEIDTSALTGNVIFKSQGDEIIDMFLSPTSSDELMDWRIKTGNISTLELYNTYDSLYSPDMAVKYKADYLGISSWKEDVYDNEGNWEGYILYEDGTIKDIVDKHGKSYGDLVKDGNGYKIKSGTKGADSNESALKYKSQGGAPDAYWGLVDVATTATGVGGIVKGGFVLGAKVVEALTKNAVQSGVKYTLTQGGKTAISKIGSETLGLSGKQLSEGLSVGTADITKTVLGNTGRDLVVGSGKSTVSDITGNVFTGIKEGAKLSKSEMKSEISTALKSGSGIEDLSGLTLQYELKDATKISQKTGKSVEDILSNKWMEDIALTPNKRGISTVESEEIVNSGLFGLTAKQLGKEIKSAEKLAGKNSTTSENLLSEWWGQNVAIKSGNSIMRKMSDDVGNMAIDVGEKAWADSMYGSIKTLENLGVNTVKSEIGTIGKQTVKESAENIFTTTVKQGAKETTENVLGTSLKQTVNQTVKQTTKNSVDDMVSNALGTLGKDAFSDATSVIAGNVLKTTAKTTTKTGTRDYVNNLIFGEGKSITSNMAKSTSKDVLAGTKGAGSKFAGKEGYTDFGKVFEVARDIKPKTTVNDFAKAFLEATSNEPVLSRLAKYQYGKLADKTGRLTGKTIAKKLTKKGVGGLLTFEGTSTLASIGQTQMNEWTGGEWGIFTDNYQNTVKSKVVDFLSFGTNKNGSRGSGFANFMGGVAGTVAMIPMFAVEAGSGVGGLVVGDKIKTIPTHFRKANVGLVEYFAKSFKENPAMALGEMVGIPTSVLVTKRTTHTITRGTDSVKDKMILGAQRDIYTSFGNYAGLDGKAVGTGFKSANDIVRAVHKVNVEPIYQGSIHPERLTTFESASPKLLNEVEKAIGYSEGKIYGTGTLGLYVKEGGFRKSDDIDMATSQAGFAEMQTHLRFGENEKLMKENDLEYIQEPNLKPEGVLKSQQALNTWASQIYPTLTNYAQFERTYKDAKGVTHQEHTIDIHDLNEFTGTYNNVGNTAKSIHPSPLYRRLFPEYNKNKIIDINDMETGKKVTQIVVEPMETSLLRKYKASFFPTEEVFADNFNMKSKVIPKNIVYKSGYDMASYKEGMAIPAKEVTGETVQLRDFAVKGLSFNVARAFGNVGLFVQKRKDNYGRWKQSAKTSREVFKQTRFGFNRTKRALKSIGDNISIKKIDSATEKMAKKDAKLDSAISKIQSANEPYRYSITAMNIKELTLVDNTGDTKSLGWRGDRYYLNAEGKPTGSGLSVGTKNAFEINGEMFEHNIGVGDKVKSSMNKIAISVPQYSLGAIESALTFKKKLTDKKYSTKIRKQNKKMALRERKEEKRGVNLQNAVMDRDYYKAEKVNRKGEGIGVIARSLSFAVEPKASHRAKDFLDFAGLTYEYSSKLIDRNVANPIKRKYLKSKIDKRVNRMAQSPYFASMARAGAKSKLEDLTPEFTEYLKEKNLIREEDYLAKQEMIKAEMPENATGKAFKNKDIDAENVEKQMENSFGTKATSPYSYAGHTKAKEIAGTSALGVVSPATYYTSNGVKKSSSYSYGTSNAYSPYSSSKAVSPYSSSKVTSPYSTSKAPSTYSPSSPYSYSSGKSPYSNSTPYKYGYGTGTTGKNHYGYSTGTQNNKPVHSTNVVTKYNPTEYTYNYPYRYDYEEEEEKEKEWMRRGKGLQRIRTGTFINREIFTPEEVLGLGYGLSPKAKGYYADAGSIVEGYYYDKANHKNYYKNTIKHSKQAERQFFEQPVPFKNPAFSMGKYDSKFVEPEMRKSIKAYQSEVKKAGAEERKKAFKQQRSIDRRTKKSDTSARRKAIKRENSYLKTISKKVGKLEYQSMPKEERYRIERANTAQKNRKSQERAQARKEKNFKKQAFKDALTPEMERIYKGGKKAKTNVKKYTNPNTYTNAVKKSVKKTANNVMNKFW